jgi:hypothetical protein
MTHGTIRPSTAERPVPRPLAPREGEFQPAPMLGFLKRRSARDEEREGTACLWCRTVIPATTREALFLAGAVLDPLAGWFCSKSCAQQYGVRFRVQPSRTPPGGSRSRR